MENLSFGYMNISLSSADIDAAIIGHLPFLENDQKTAVLSVIEAFAPVPDAGDHWDDPAFVSEMDRRLTDYENGRVNCKSLAEVVASTLMVIDETRKNNEVH